MTFKLKAWMIYLICLAAIPFPLALVFDAFGLGTDRGLGFAAGEFLFYVALIGGVIVGLYYVGKRDKKKRENS